MGVRRILPGADFGRSASGVDTLGHLLALRVTAADEQDRAQIGQLAQQVQQATGETVEVAFVDQGYTGDDAAEQAAQHGIRLEVVKLLAAKRQERVRFAASALGGRAQFRLAGTLSALDT